MKKIILSFCMLSMAGMSVFAQLKISNTGKVGICLSDSARSCLAVNYHGSSAYAAYIRGNTYGIFGERNGVSERSWGWGLDGRSENFSGGISIGVMGCGFLTETETGSGRSLGVCARGGYATSGYNYGIIGNILGTSYGAGIYGSSVSGDLGYYVDGRYAGFFRGNVKITGNLTVNGNISGTILSNAAPMESRSIEPSASRLGNLTAVSYSEQRHATPSAITESDTLIVEDGLTGVEQQRLSRHHYGIPVDQLEKWYPELVYAMEDGTKRVDYMGMIPLLVQAINDLKAEVDELKQNQK